MNLGLLAPPNGTGEDYPPGSAITVCYYLSWVFESCSSPRWRTSLYSLSTSRQVTTLIWIRIKSRKCPCFIFRHTQSFSLVKSHNVTSEADTVALDLSPFVVCRLFFQPFKAYWLRDATTGLTFNNSTFCPHCIYVFCIYMGTNSDLCLIQHTLIGFYNRDEKCLLRGTDWFFK